MTSVINAILMVLSAVLIVLVLIQPSKNDGINSITSSNQSLSLFKNMKVRGMEKKVERITWICVAAFLGLVILELYL